MLSVASMAVLTSVRELDLDLRPHHLTRDLRPYLSLGLNLSRVSLSLSINLSPSLSLGQSNGSQQGNRSRKIPGLSSSNNSLVNLLITSSRTAVQEDDLPLLLTLNLL